MSTGSLKRDGVWNEDLKCCWLTIECTDPTTVTFTVPDLHSTDMYGTVAFARRLNPNVRAIFIKQLDAYYHLYKLDVDSDSNADISNWSSYRRDTARPGLAFALSGGKSYRDCDEA